MITDTRTWSPSHRRRHLLLAVAALAASIGTPVRAETERAASATDAADRGGVAIDVAVTGNELVEVLDGLADKGGARVRIMSVPSTCTGMAGEALWSGSGGIDAEFALQRIDGASFLQALTGIDFGRIDVAERQLHASWYACPGTIVYTMFRDAGGRHFVIADGGTPFLAWSVPQP